MNRIKRLLILLAVALIALTTLTPVTAQDPLDPAHYEWVVVADGFYIPLYLTHDGTERLFVVEQTGYIWVIEDGAVLIEPFLDIAHLVPSTVAQGGYTERGLLGLAFHPDYANNGYFFINYTNTEGHTIVARYQRLDATHADPASAEVVMMVEQPYDNHNGGHLAFGPDGNLYIGFGDGGGAGDPDGNGQDPTNVLGTLARINVDTLPYSIPDNNPFIGRTGFQPEIWAYGLRNPWRFSFDRETGDMYIGDVGQGEWEELDFQPADSPGGQNYGWNAREGTNAYFGSPYRSTPDMVEPFFVYDHILGCSVTGGYVYRGSALPALQGVYVFGDYCNGRIWLSQRNRFDQWQTRDWMLTERPIASFGEDVNGELYLVDYKGFILRLTAVE